MIRPVSQRCLPVMKGLVTKGDREAIILGTDRGQSNKVLSVMARQGVRVKMKYRPGSCQ